MEEKQIKKFKKFGIEWIKVVHSKYRVKKYILGIKVSDEIKFEKKFQEQEEKLNNDTQNILKNLNNSENILNTLNDRIINLETFAATIQSIVSKTISISELHKKTFREYKNINVGKTVVLVATGPTLIKYKPIENAIHVGVNAAFKFDNVKLDYLFLLDYINVKKYIAEANVYEKNTCKKFYGLFSEDHHVMHIPETEALKANASRYYINKGDFDINEQFNYDIENNPLACFWSVIFQAAQFALYTNPAKIYLVGCDCNAGGHFDGTQQSFENQESTKLHGIKNLDGWKKFKEFAQLYYPDTEIISINPVGLKGLFKDISTLAEEETFNE